ncbi:hypothetical protein M758_6G066300 [Ceratodon purpureus]|nr:hypothetical protein M758_6G066300 [Ceratodon purpureus]
MILRPLFCVLCIIHSEAFFSGRSRHSLVSPKNRFSFPASRLNQDQYMFRCYVSVPGILVKRSALKGNRY